MKLRQLIEDDNAVSPVIGVILMVAITVILAAVIGTFVMGLGDDLGDSAPQASFNFDHSSGSQDLTVSHNGGDKIEAANLNNVVNDPDNVASLPAWDNQYTDVTAGASITGQDFSGNERVSVNWQGDSGSATLGKWEGPDA